MKVVYGLDKVAPLSRSVLTVGNFDGVHVGHQEIVRRARRLADDGGDPVVALTFDPHPLTIVAPAKAPLRLMSVEERVQRLAEAGADLVVVAKSENSLLGLEAETFIEDVLVARFHPRHVVEGTSFGFGKGRKGSPQLLQETMRRFECEVHIIEPVFVAGDGQTPIAVSSSMIRRCLEAGHVRQAAKCLGRPYAIESTVIRGASRGKMLGFPTANFQTPTGQVEPAEGVYAGDTVVNGSRYRSAISIGRAETFGDKKRKLETHLLEFDGDLYGKLIRVEFRTWIRAQKRFEAAEELKAQIRADIGEAGRPAR